MDWEKAANGVKKKATFEASVQNIINWCGQPGPKAAEDAQKLEETVKRIQMLCKSRYSSPAFWVKARDLIVASQRVITDPKRTAQLDAYLKEAGYFLEDGSSSGASTTTSANGAGASTSGRDAAVAANSSALFPQQQQRQPFLFEGQLSAEPEHEHGAARWYRAAQALAERNAAGVAGGGGEGEGGGTEETQEAALNRQFGEILETLLGNVSGTGDGGGGLWETDLLGEGFQFEDFAQPVARPASKKVVRRLKRVKLTRELVEGLGGESAVCPVCMESFKEGDEVHVLPCGGKHSFHPPCLAPWLAANHSCPMCRHELPTDDEEYERRKVRERDAAEERRGAENAVRGGEFIYL